MQAQCEVEDDDGERDNGNIDIKAPSPAEILSKDAAENRAQSRRNSPDGTDDSKIERPIAVVVSYACEADKFER